MPTSTPTLDILNDPLDFIISLTPSSPIISSKPEAHSNLELKLELELELKSKRKTTDSILQSLKSKSKSNSKSNLPLKVKSKPFVKKTNRTFSLTTSTTPSITTTTTATTNTLSPPLSPSLPSLSFPSSTFLNNDTSTTFTSSSSSSFIITSTTKPTTTPTLVIPLFSPPLPSPPTLNLPPIPPMLLTNIEKSSAALYRCKRAVFITGAGISVSAGIPDFRSEQGLYAQLKQKYPKLLLKGSDLFDASLFRNKTTTQVFYSFIAELKKLTNQAKQTNTHRFLQSLYHQGKLLRCYTQNIDGLEFPESQFHSSPSKLTSTTKSSSLLHPLIQLHGTLEKVVCSVCQMQYPFKDSFLNLYQQGHAPLCPHCEEIQLHRQLKHQRTRTQGFLRPAIVLYNEVHPQGDWIAECVEKDIHKKPDLLIVMGTSLKVPGVKRLVRDLANAVHQQKKGLVILVNRTPLPSKEWNSIFDMVFTEDVDLMVRRWTDWMQYYQQRSKLYRSNKNTTNTNTTNTNGSKRKRTSSHLTTTSTKQFNLSIDELNHQLGLENPNCSNTKSKTTMLTTTTAPVKKKQKKIPVHPTDSNHLLSRTNPLSLQLSPPTPIHFIQSPPCSSCKENVLPSSFLNRVTTSNLKPSAKQKVSSTIKELGFPVIKTPDSSSLRETKSSLLQSYS